MNDNSGSHWSDFTTNRYAKNPLQSDDQQTQHTGKLGAGSLMLVSNDAYTSIPYHFIRRKSLEDTLMIFASEVIVEIVGDKTQLKEIMSGLHREVIDELAVGQHGITHINFLDNNPD